MQKRLQVFVYGIVQGVGYRYFVVHRAMEFGLFGFVKNLQDGAVEIVAEGEEKSLKEFLLLLEKGTSFAVIKKISSNFSVPNGEFSSFQVNY